MASLASLIQKNPELKSKSVSALIGFCGEGKLRNGSECSREFREFLREVEGSHIQKFIMECLDGDMNEGGFALQDMVNEMGRRLGFSVAFGLYQGNRNDIGNDGLWRDEEGYSFIVEVKTTDAYRISTDKIDEYRMRLIGEGKVEREKSYNLIVVGRQDTGDLEAQIRGSVHAWHTRIISVDALWKLLSTKEKLDDPNVIKLITRCLMPFEYTRLDRLIDLVFNTSRDAAPLEVAEALEEGRMVESGERKWTVPSAFHDDVTAVINNKLGVKLQRESRSLYSTGDKSIGCIVIVSKSHSSKTFDSYWFAFHPHQETAIAPFAVKFIALGCGSSEKVFLIPIQDFLPWRDNMSTTDGEDRKYWHIKVHHRHGGEPLLEQPVTGKPIKIEKYRILPKGT